MEKLKIDLHLVLPDVPDEKDECVNRIIQQLQDKKGIDKVHIVPETGNSKAQLCFHYDPNTVTVEQVKRIVEQAGAEITDRYKHLLLEVEGIRHQRQTNAIETALKNRDGILSVAASAGGVISIEYDTTQVTKNEIYSVLQNEGLRVTGNRSKEIKTHAHPSHQHAHEHAHDHKHEPGETDDHAHGGIFGRNTELVFSIICGSLLAAGFGLSFVRNMPAAVALVFYLCAYFFGGFFTAKEAIQTIARGGFEIDFLMLVAAIGAGILGSWAEGALLLFLFSMGHALEHYAMAKAQKSIKALTELAPKTALVKSGNGVQEVSIEALNTGDVIIVKPNTKISADGIVVSGNSAVNQAPITGESMPVDKIAFTDAAVDPAIADKLDPQFRVFAGTINGNAVLEVKVSKKATDSTLSRLVKMVSEAQTQKSPTQQFTDKIEKYFVPSVLALVTLLCFAYLLIDETFSASFYRAMAVLVAASPCALAISTPSAVLSGVARAARGGVLIKGGKPLEDLGALKAVAFDKTGTLTEGKPKLTHVIALDITENDLLKMVVAVESLSDHPLAKAIVQSGKEKLGNEPIPSARHLEAVLGKGVKAILGNDTIYAGNLALFEKLDTARPSQEIIQKVHALEEQGNTTMLVRRNNDYAGIIALMDAPRAEAKETLEQLKQVGIEKMIMLTGDNQKVADAVARQIGITEARGGMLPEQKIEAIAELAHSTTRVAMVGDGVNDAPAMAKSTVGIAMGAAGSDVALETADIALMGDQLLLLPFAIALSRKSKQIIRQNLWISMGMVTLLIPLTILNLASIGPAVIAHEGSTLVVVFNALRLLAFKNNNIEKKL